MKSVKITWLIVNALALIIAATAYAQAPTITTQPYNQSALLGGTTMFSVTAGGSPTLTYQWRFNGTNIANGTNAVLVLANLQTNNAGTYSVVVTNSQGFATSSNATLTLFDCFPALDVVLVIDRSGSMGEQSPTKLAATKSAATNFISSLQLTEDQVGLVSFADSATSNSLLTNNATPVINAIMALNASGNTAIGAGITNAQIELSSVRHHTNALPLMILLTDGVPTVPSSNPTGAATNAAVVQN